MRIFAIRDEEMRPVRNLAYLFYYERQKQFYIEVPEGINPWDLPMILFNFARRGEYTLDGKWSMAWVSQRIVPPDRQNLGQILRDNGLSEYDEFKLLMLCHGRCAQDSCYLSEISEDGVPDEIMKRLNCKVYAAFPLENNRMIVFFRDGQTRLCDIAALKKSDRTYQRLLAYHDAFRQARVLAGGYGVAWNHDQMIDDRTLYRNGTAIPVTYKDLRSALADNLVDTAQATQLLGCTRQYINTLVKEKKLHPLLQSGKSTIFLRSDLQPST